LRIPSCSCQWSQQHMMRIRLHHHTTPMMMMMMMMMMMIVVVASGLSLIHQLQSTAVTLACCCCCCFDQDFVIRAALKSSVEVTADGRRRLHCEEGGTGIDQCLIVIVRAHVQPGKNHHIITTSCSMTIACGSRV
jgi:hypothetical protein